MVEKKLLKGLRPKLMLAFLLLSIVPFSIVSVLFLYSYSKDLTEQTTSHLESVREIKKNQVRDYFGELKQQATLFSQSNLAKASIGRGWGFSATFERLGGAMEESRYIAQQMFEPNSWDKLKDQEAGYETTPLFTSVTQGDDPYKKVHSSYHKEYAKLVRESDFSDIALIDTKGNVVYSVTKRKDFGTNIISGPYRQSPQALVYQKLKVRMDHSQNPLELYQFLDFSLNPVSKEVVAYIAIPIMQHSYVRGVIVFEIANQGLNAIMAEREGLGKTGESFVVGNDGRLRSDLSLTPAYSVANSFTNGQYRLSSFPVNTGLKGDTGAGKHLSYQGEEVLAAYTQVSVLGSNWALVTEISVEEAFALTRQLEKLVVSLAFIFVILFILFSRWLSNSITAPLLNLTWSAELVAAGDLEKPIRGVNPDGDEIGRLAHSFAHMQYSVSEKLQLIGQQKQELEAQVELIQKQNKELQVADKLKDEFLANTSHELRTPIHGIVGMAESLIAGSAGELTQPQRQQLALIIKSSEGLARLVNDLLDYHKMRYGQLPINLQPIDLNSVVNLVFDLCQHLIGNKPVRLINQLEEKLPIIYADELRLEQVLYNLIGNAIKYTPEGKVVIGAVSDEEWVSIVITDTGIGMKEEQIKHIFEPLVQVRDDKHRAKSGYGLGLSVSKQLVNLMGGEIQVSSKPDLGSTFSFSLPLSTTQDIEPVVATEAKDQHLLLDTEEDQSLIEPFQLQYQMVEDPNSRTILVVDDEMINLQILQNLLSLQGYQVFCCQDGHEALAVLEVEKPDLMLVDVMMPTMTGFELCQKIRETYDMLSLPVIFLTALNQPKDLIEGFEAGANDYLVKPFCKDELYARIDAHIKAKASTEQLVENKLLKQEITEHISVQQGLQSTQRRLMVMLEQANEPLIGITLDGLIQFVSYGAEILFQLEQEEMLHATVDKLLVAPFNTQLDAVTDGQNESHELELACVNVNGPFFEKVTITPAKFDNNPGWSIIFHRIPEGVSEQSSSPRVSALSKAINSLSKYVVATDGKLIEELRGLGPDFTELADKLVQGAPADADPIRTQIVDVMRHSLDYWQKATNESKIELAEKSKLWRVYLDRSSLQTRTLDKYLQIDTLPKSPRWRTVLSTAEYVLENCELEGELRGKVELSKNALRLQVSKVDN